MSSFTDRLIVSPNDNFSSWTIVERFRYWLVRLHVGDVITVAEGSTTDFASIPRILWSLLSPYGLYGKAAVIHDYLYRLGGVVNVAEDGMPLRMRKFSRSECDQIFYEAMECLGVGWFTRHIMWIGVRVGGYWAYKD